MKDETKNVKPTMTVRLIPGASYRDTDRFRERYKVALMVAVIEEERKCSTTKSEEPEHRKT